MKRSYFIVLFVIIALVASVGCKAGCAKARHLSNGFENVVANGNVRQIERMFEKNYNYAENRMKPVARNILVRNMTQTCIEYEYYDIPQKYLEDKEYFVIYRDYITGKMIRDFEKLVTIQQLEQAKVKAGIEELVKVIDAFYEEGREQGFGMGDMETYRSDAEDKIIRACLENDFKAVLYDYFTTVEVNAVIKEMEEEAAEIKQQTESDT